MSKIQKDYEKIIDKVGFHIKVAKAFGMSPNSVRVNWFNGYKIIPTKRHKKLQKLIDNASWHTLKASSVFTTIDINTMFILSKLYKIQSEGVEATLKNIVAILSSRESLEKNNLRGTILLLRNAFNEIVSQEIFLIEIYEQVIAEIEISDNAP